MPSDTGVSIIEALQRDWQIFEDSLSINQKRNLLFSISSDKSFYKLKVISRYSNKVTIINKWEEFKKELQHENRFFPKKAIDTMHIKELLDYLVLGNGHYPKSIFRARINRDHREYSIKELGKPPIDKAPDGRANPKGISYFYGASNQVTAIAETRPYKSELVSVGEFFLKRDIVLIDLRNPRITISPFGLDDDNLVLLFTQHMPFLLHLGRSLSIPILPHKKDLEYLPTQYLCELIKDHGFEGIVFKSSLGAGDNFVIFNDDSLNGKKVEYFRNDEIIIKPVKVKISNTTKRVY